MYLLKRIAFGVWAEFKLELDKLRGNLDEHASPLLFRGQPNSQWRLRTTLERHGGGGGRLNEYYRLKDLVKPEGGKLPRVGRRPVRGGYALVTRENGFCSFSPVP